MTLTDRDRKIVLALVPVLVFVAYWFLLLAPKRADSSKLGDQLAKQEVKRDQAQQQLAALKAAQASFADDYATVVKLGKAIPTTVDMPSLIVQLNSAAKGTGIAFESIKVGERQSASSTTGSTGAASSSGGSSSTGSGGSSSTPPASAAGGEKASTGPGQAAEKANDAKATADSKTAQTGGTGSSTSSSSSGSSSSTSTPTGASVPGLDSVPLEFTFKGGFFDLADFFHQLKRFVRVANTRISVHGRLMVVNGFTFKASAFPRLEAQVFATVYLTPKDQGATAGATPGGPSSPSTASPSTPASSGSSPAPPPSTPPAAVSAR